MDTLWFLMGGPDLLISCLISEKSLYQKAHYPKLLNSDIQSELLMQTPVLFLTHPFQVMSFIHYLFLFVSNSKSTKRYHSIFDQWCMQIITVFTFYAFLFWWLFHGGNVSKPGCSFFPHIFITLFCCRYVLHECLLVDICYYHNQGRHTSLT